MITTHVYPITTTGSDGAATGAATTELLLGELVDVHLDYHASAPATTDVTLSYATLGDPLLTVANSATDARYHPRASLVTTAGAAITDGHAALTLCDRVTIAVAGSNALATAVTVTIRVRRT